MRNVIFVLAFLGVTLWAVDSASAESASKCSGKSRVVIQESTDHHFLVLSVAAITVLGGLVLVGLFLTEHIRASQKRKDDSSLSIPSREADLGLSPFPSEARQ